MESEAKGGGDVIEIKHRDTGAVLWAGEAKSLRAAVETAVRAGANLAHANLADTNLAHADLSYAYLEDANLADTNLAHADLSYAYLEDAYLAYANLAGADLADANLADANLSYANLRGATMPDGRKWGAYVIDPLAGICDEPEARRRAVAAWGNHEWSNCPMHAAHGWGGLGDAPVDKRIAVAAFVAVFDARLLPAPRKEAV